MAWIVLIGVTVAVLLPEAALALSYYDGKMAQQCPESGLYLGRVAPCIQLAIRAASTVFLERFSDALSPTILAFMTLAVVFFGVQLVRGESEVQQKAVGFIFKIGIVFLFADNLGGLAENTFDVMEEATIVVTDTLGPRDSVCITQRDAAVDTSVFRATTGVGMIWDRLDCLIDRLFGLGGGGEGTGLVGATMFQNGLMGFLSAAVAGGAMGINVFTVGGLALFTVVFYLFRAAYIFLLAYIYLGFLVALSPFFVALILMGQTHNYFYKWTSDLMGAIAMPALVFAYLAVTLPIMEDMIFTNKESLQVKFGDELRQMYRNNQQFCSEKVGMDEDYYKKLGAGAPNPFTDELRQVLSPVASGATDLCTFFSFNTVDMSIQDTKTGQYHDHITRMIELFNATIRILVTALILAMVMGGIPTLAVALFQGGTALSRRVDQTNQMFDSTIRGGIGAVTGSPTAVAGGPSSVGSFFSRGIPGLVGGR